MAVNDLPIVRNVRKNGIHFRGSDDSEFGSINDKALKEKLKIIKASHKKLEELDNDIRHTLDLPSDKTQSMVARVFHQLIPQRVYGIMPASLMKFVAEEYDVLEYIETLLRSSVDDIQEALRVLAYWIEQKCAEHEQIFRYLKQAREEDLDAYTLQLYIADHAGIKIFREVAELLDNEFNLLTPEQKEEQKQDILQQLEFNVENGKQFVDYLGQVWAVASREFSKGVFQYFSYLTVYKPLAAVRDAARILTNMNQAMYGAKDAIKATFQTSLKALELAADAAEMADIYSIAAPDMSALIESGKKRLENKLEQLEQGRALRNSSDVIKLIQEEIRPKAANL